MNGGGCWTFTDSGHDQDNTKATEDDPDPRQSLPTCQPFPLPRHEDDLTAGPSTLGVKPGHPGALPVGWDRPAPWWPIDTHAQVAPVSGSGSSVMGANSGEQM